MILTAHPPSYLPRLSFFQKMLAADVFVLTDDFQYSTHGLINRTRIKTVSGATWLTVPVLSKGRRGQPISAVKIDTTRHWRRRHWRTLQVNYAYAPFFEKFADWFQALYARRWRFLLDLNLHFIEEIHRRFAFSVRLVRSSQLQLSARGPLRLVEMAQQLQCEAFLAEPQYRGYLSSRDFNEQGVTLRFAEFPLPQYHQLFGEFVPDLSFVDLLFNEGDEALKCLGSNG